MPAGKDYLLKWAANTPGPVTITLREGNTGNLQDVGQIVMLEKNWGNYTWAVPKEQKPGKDYALQIQWGVKPAPGDENYSGKFEIVSGGDSPGNSNSTQTTSTRPPHSGTKSATSGAPTPTGTKNNKTTSATGSSQSPSGTSNEKPTNKATSTSVPAGAPGAFGASAASVAAVVAVAAAVLFN